MPRRMVSLPLLLLLSAVPAFALPIGGVPERQESAIIELVGGGTVELFSYVFNAPGSLPADSGIVMNKGDFLYAYILNNRSAASDVLLFGVSLPRGLLLSDVGWYDSDTGALRGVNEPGPASCQRTPKGVDFAFGAGALPPGEFSEVMYFLTSAPSDATLASVWLSSGAIGLGYVLGPSEVNHTMGVAESIPEPSDILLTGVLITLVHRRRRRPVSFVG